MACAAAITGHTALFFALEQSRQQVMMRAHNLLSSTYGSEVFQAMDLMRGKNVDLWKYRQFCKKLAEDLDGHLVVDDTSRGKVTPFTIAAQIEKYQPHEVFVDYLQLMDMSGGGRGGEQWQQLGAISGQLKEIAGKYNVGMVAASQINRMGIGKQPPGAEHLAGADSIGRDVDGLITMKKQTSRIIQMRLAKYRHGFDGMKWYVQQDLKRGLFTEVNGNDAFDMMQEDREDATGGDDDDD
jgi:predicted ATP-dependent serine protease